MVTAGHSGVGQYAARWARRTGLASVGSGQYDRVLLIGRPDDEFLEAVWLDDTVNVLQVELP